MSIRVEERVEQEFEGEPELSASLHLYFGGCERLSEHPNLLRW
jgi:hypothetical protein